MVTPPPRHEVDPKRERALRELVMLDVEARSSEAALAHADREREQTESHTRLLAFASSVLVALVVGGTLLAAYSVEHANRRSQATRLREAAERGTHFVEERFVRYQRIPAGVSALFRASEHVTESEFRDYVTSLELSRVYDGVLSVAYISRVGEADLASFTTTTAAETQGFTVHPNGARGDYFVVRWIEPLPANRWALGFDVGSDPVRRAAALEAELTGDPVITKRVSLVHDGLAGDGFVLFEAIGPHGATAGLAPRSKGWAAVAFKSVDFFDGVDHAVGVRSPVRIVDPSDPSGKPLYVSPGFEAASNERATSRTMHLGAETWRIDVRRGPTFVTPSERDDARTILYLGLLASFLTAGLAWSVLRTRSRSIELAEETTAALRRSHAELERIASQDPLTGAANRRAFDQRIEEEFSRAVRRTAPLSLVMIDVDQFKAFNDRYGHQDGDQCLRSVGQAALSVVRRAGEVVARYGGEEFAIILPESNAEEALRTAERIRESVESLAIAHASQPLGVVTISLGVATLDPAAMHSYAELVRAADEALYRAKRAGRNRVEHAA